MPIERREFLKLSWVSAASLLISWCWVKVSNLTKDILEDSPELRDKKHIEEIKYEMSCYSEKYSRWIKPDLKKFKNIWDKNLFWSTVKNEILPKNISWTFINKDLYWKLDMSIAEKNPIIIAEDFEWKKILKFYVNWNLEVATFISPWSLWTKTPRGEYCDRWLTDKYHTSWNKERRWAVMPYAVWVTWTIRLHWSDWIVNWDNKDVLCK